MKSNEVKYMQFHEIHETTTWQTTKKPTTNLLNSVQKSICVKLEVCQTTWSCSSSKRPIPHLPHLPPGRRVLHWSAHTHQLFWSPTVECWGKSTSCTPWTRDSSDKQPSSPTSGSRTHMPSYILFGRHTWQVLMSKLQNEILIEALSKIKCHCLSKIKVGMRSSLKLYLRSKQQIP